ncbi:MAG: Holliday junction resolvase RuvX [Candidatus Marinimicrobia bacterium]|nr:Holliday junction resolvase RuvX [Candidatus Neomarinimicrobiota bacterium]MBL7023251.1 Holliday junction resolvase RuvX [Candidatus Neomarinimicrobiota bacterium]MBL7108845.1 Holliday junction resolvase RuvX [Candidatus Neomarinimicrobiota bacterium]
MRILGIDFGDRRIGLAISDPMGIIASPYSTIDRKIVPDIFSEIDKIILKHNISKIVVGLPLTMKGTDSEQTKKVREFVEELKTKINLPIKVIDERLSSLSAQKVLVEQGIKTGHNKGEIDKTAAAILLQEYLETKN